MGAMRFGEWRTVLWYQGTSRVVPEWRQGAKGVQTAVLNIANAYATQSQTSPDPRWKAEGTMQKPRARPPKATSKPPQSLLIARGLRPQSHLNATLKPPKS
jgi:hypothetical protein